MKIKSHHHINYLISVQFDKGFLPDTLNGKNELCLYFLNDLAKLARASGHKLHAIYSIVSGENGYHAHFGVSWLPVFLAKREGYCKPRQHIQKMPIIELLENSYFYVGNRVEAIKKVTTNKKIVELYIIHQPKDGQKKEFSDTFIFEDFVPQLLERKIQFYYSREQFCHVENMTKNIHNPSPQFVSLAFIFQLLLIMAYIALLA